MLASNYTPASSHMTISKSGLAGSADTCAHLFSDNFTRLLDQSPIFGQVAETQWRRSTLLTAKKLAGPAKFKIGFRNSKTVAGLFHDLKPALRIFGFSGRDQNAVRVV